MSRDVSTDASAYFERLGLYCLARSIVSDDQSKRSLKSDILGRLVIEGANSGSQLDFDQNCNTSELTPGFSVSRCKLKREGGVSTVVPL